MNDLKAPVRERIAAPVQLPPSLLPEGMELPPVPSRMALAVPWPVRLLLERAGLLVEAQPLIPSAHLEQTRRLIREWGWCQSMDLSPTGRLCIRGAQGVLERVGYVTRSTRKQSEKYMQDVLAMSGVVTSFYAWNDMDDRTASQVDALLRDASRLAYQKGH